MERPFAAFLQLPFFLFSSTVASPCSDQKLFGPAPHVLTVYEHICCHSILFQQQCAQSMARRLDPAPWFVVIHRVVPANGLTQVCKHQIKLSLAASIRPASLSFVRYSWNSNACRKSLRSCKCRWAPRELPNRDSCTPAGSPTRGSSKTDTP